MNDTIEMRVKPSCLVCGNEGIVIPENPTEDSIITCPNCGSDLGTHGQFEEHVKQGAVDLFEDELRKALSGIPNLTLK